ncbi:hypothetical protein OL548_17835 [Lysinibacillus sp. MHQ-1]|nr:hypothetical protein OL548_17835 [Lysinibacillus sp. MHQ-1]
MADNNAGIANDRLGEEDGLVKAIIFDFDGTIIDTETAWYTVF